MAAEAINPVSESELNHPSYMHSTTTSTPAGSFAGTIGRRERCLDQSGRLSTPHSFAQPAPYLPVLLHILHQLH